ncbi:hypothetical protein TNIN_265881 [Trichonephila inaurata madagascariensis]|uniref:EF-hand domain-containing protein n=1 Tax=Trichonephila inaurata madagascariensis TaxID=2747483 RepID=A0A8X6YJM8_9ARAC|nr:hypothetical protein TNIN_265881 [Trichonephila inaurata madagascariensis]
MAISKDRPKDLEDTFDIMCETNQSEDGKLSVDNVKNWFRHAEVVGLATGINDKDVEKTFTNVSKDKKGVDFEEFKKMVENLARSRKSDPNDLFAQLSLTIPPAVQEAVDSVKEKVEIL